MTRSAAALAAAVLAVAALAGCSAASGQRAAQAAASHAAGPAAASARPGTGQTARARTESLTGAAGTCDPTAASLAPPAGPPRVTGSWMAAIRKRGYLIAGVDQSTYHFGYLNPLDGKIEGFDIDMIRAVAQAIFGDPDKVQYKAISDADRIPDVTNGSVDIVAHTMTITCDRLKLIDFSGVYFESHQRVLVLADSRAAGLANLGGQKVCATNGSDSAKFIADYPSHPRLVTVNYWTDCLVLLQQRDVAAVSTDDTILNGLAAQDPFTRLVGPNLTDEPYGLAISKQHPEFVRFVNGVLARMEADGAWEKSYNHWVSPAHVNPPVLKYADLSPIPRRRPPAPTGHQRCVTDSSACTFTTAPMSPQDPSVTARRPGRPRPACCRTWMSLVRGNSDNRGNGDLNSILNFR